MSAYLKHIALLVLALAITGQAFAQPDGAPPVPGLVIGSLARPAEGSRWAVTGGNHRTLIARNDENCAGHLISVEIRPDAGGECSEAMLAERALLAHPGAFGGPQFETIARPGFTIKAVLIDMACRNWTGPVHACAAVSGDLYMCAADGGGCSNTPPRFHEPVLEFLDGLVLAPH